MLRAERSLRKKKKPRGTARKIARRFRETSLYRKGLNPSGQSRKHLESRFLLSSVNAKLPFDFQRGKGCLNFVIRGTPLFFILPSIRGERCGERRSPSERASKPTIRRRSVEHNFPRWNKGASRADARNKKTRKIDRVTWDAKRFFFEHCARKIGARFSLSFSLLQRTRICNLFQEKLISMEPTTIRIWYRVVTSARSYDLLFSSYSR